MTLQLGLEGMPRPLFACTPSRLTTWLDCPRRDDARGSLALALYALGAAATLRRACTRVELHHLPSCPAAEAAGPAPRPLDGLPEEREQA